MAIQNKITKTLPEVVADYDAAITKRLAAGIITQKQVDELGIIEDDMELFAYQNIQSRAFAQGILNFEQANYLYRNLGGEFPTKEKFNSKTPAERAVITKLCGELLLLQKS